MASCNNCVHSKPKVSGGTIRLYCEPFKRTYTHSSPGSASSNAAWDKKLREHAEACSRFEAEC